MSTFDHDKVAAATDGDHSTTLGERLRHAREIRELSQADLAMCLRLEPRIIKALEDNAFDQLPAPAFIRGYVRSIAKELGVDNEPLLQALDLQFQRDPPALMDFESRAPNQITSDTAIVKYTSIGVIAITLVLVVLWWLGETKKMDVAPPSAPDPQPAADVLPPGLLNPPQTTPLEYPFELLDEQTQLPSAVAPDAGLPPVPAEATALPLEESAPVTTDTASQSDDVPAADILISSSEDAWVEIRDASDERLHYGLIRPGEAASVNGNAPFNLVIGNAPSVEVIYQGQIIDLTSFSQEGVARVSLPLAQ